MKEQNTKTTVLLTLTGLFASMITVMTAYIFHVPYGANGGYIHFGDALIYVAAVILPRPYALAAAAIGGGLADLLTAPMWAPATIIIKMLIVLPFTSQTGKLLTKRNIIAPFLSALLSAAGYYLAYSVPSAHYWHPLQAVPSSPGAVPWYFWYLQLPWIRSTSSPEQSS